MAFLSLWPMSPLQLMLLLAALLTAAWVLQPTRSPYNSFPRVPRPLMPWPWSKPVKQSLKEGYELYIKPRGSPFVMRWWAKDYLVLPPKYFSDLRTAHGPNVSFFQNLSDALYLDASAGDLYERPQRMIDTIKTGLNSHLTQLTPLICSEADTAMEAEIGNFEGWKEFTASSAIFAISHRISCRFLINEELARNERFIKASTTFVTSIFLNAFLIKLMPLGVLRNWLKYPLSYFHRRNLNTAINMVLPEIKQRMNDRENRGGGEDATKLDALEWMLSIKPAKNTHNAPYHIAKELLHNLWAGAGSPGVVTTLMLYQVLMEPEYLEPLRAEAEQSIKAYGWTEKGIQNLPLQDSFIRELNRVNPLLCVICTRTVKHEPWQLSDGLLLPVGTRCIWPASPILKDPDNFANPDMFDGFRFARLAEQMGQSGEAANKYSAGYVSTTNLTFGFGNHSCPGRFYGLREIKAMFTKLILNYDIMWAQPQKKHPADLDIEGQTAPNLGVKIRLKKR